MMHTASEVAALLTRIERLEHRVAELEHPASTHVFVPYTAIPPRSSTGVRPTPGQGEPMGPLPKRRAYDIVGDTTLE